MKTHELTGRALDWAVARCLDVYCFSDTFRPSTDWAQGGPIIERERITVDYCNSDTSESIWSACSVGWTYYFGPTPLIAAMRCYVVSKLGDNVDIPKEMKCEPLFT